MSGWLFHLDHAVFFPHFGLTLRQGGLSAMNIAKKQCVHCGREFWPDPRVGKRQKRCFREECRRAENCRKARKWIQLNPDVLPSLRAKRRVWAKAYPNYWRRYRKNHPTYCLRDNQRRAASLRKARCSAKLTSIREIAVDKLQRIEAMIPADCSAKLTEIDRRVDGIVEYLFWTVRKPLSAKQTYTDLRAGSEVG